MDEQVRAPHGKATAMTQSVPPDAKESLVENSAATGGQPGRRGVRLAAWLVAGLLALLGAGYVVAHFVASDSAPRNASVNGVDIGGLGVPQATELLIAELGPGDREPVTITGEPGQQATIDPADAGLAVDYQATVHRAGADAAGPRVLVKVSPAAARPHQSFRSTANSWRLRSGRSPRTSPANRRTPASPPRAARCSGPDGTAPRWTSMAPPTPSPPPSARRFGVRRRAARPLPGGR